MKLLLKIKEHAMDKRMAVICDGEELSYEKMDKLSDAFAAYMLEKYKDDKSPIVIYGNKSNLILVLIVAALKSGRAYVPLDVTFPIERVNQVIKEVNPTVIVNFTDNFIDNKNVFSEEEMLLETNKYKEAVVSQDNWLKEDENAYILFTSGSTGLPKGVQITKNNIDSFTNWFEKFLGMDKENDVIMNQVSYSFDVSVIPIYLGLICGKTLFSLSKDTLEDFKRLFNSLNVSNIKTWVSTPALAEICIKDSNFNIKLMPKLETLFFAGEVLSKKLVKDLMNRFPGVRIINGYGPTEGTVLLSAIDVTEEMLEDHREIPIGYPMEGAILKIVDENGNTLPDGEKGELLAIGNSISKGYFNNEEITEKVFFTENIGDKLLRGYRTGDLAYYDNNMIYYCGRKDFQIKLNGFRIELEDIENNLRRVSSVNNCAVFPIYKEDKISHIMGVVTLNEDNGLSNLKNSILIKNELKKYIPSYMIPRNIKVIKQFPVNTNGKIDRKGLMEEIK